MKLFQFILSFSLLLILSCKPQKQANETASKTPVAANTATDAVVINNGEAEVAVPPGQNMQSATDISYRLIISFISIGEGTDRNAKEIFDSFLNDWKTNQKKEINYETVHWGREGEVDYCFPLSGLNEAQQKQFVSGFREKFKGHDLIQFAENEPCRHKR
jgi:hypothetical protein